MAALHLSWERECPSCSKPCQETTCKLLVVSQAFGSVAAVLPSRVSCPHLITKPAVHIHVHTCGFAPAPTESEAVLEGDMSAACEAMLCGLWQESGVCLVLLSSRQDAFHRLSDSAARLQRQLAESGVPQVLLSFEPACHTACCRPQLNQALPTSMHTEA